MKLDNQTAIEDIERGLRRPPVGENNLWYLDRRTQSVIVFVHGVLSDSRDCWFYEDSETPSRNMYWPALIESDRRFPDVSIYLGGYYTAIDSKTYEIRNCADELFSALARAEESGAPGVLSREEILFVCHSTGGIVTRYLLEYYRDKFQSKKIGLLLIASPSYGSKLADRLAFLAGFYNQRLGIQLKWGNWSLRDLDARFKDLVNDRAIPSLIGMEAFENRFIIHRKFWPNKLVVVTEESAGRYFGAPRLLRETDHFSCVKPDDTRHPAHQLLVDFWHKFRLLSSPNAIALDQAAREEALRSLATLATRDSTRVQARPRIRQSARQQRVSPTYDERYRSQMLHKVRREWIAGVLYNSLYKVGGLKLGLTHRADAIKQSLNVAIRGPNRTSVPMRSPIGKLFSQVGDALLILGAPGAGKTTLLLQLTKDLLARASRETDQPVPVVFNLSSWAIRHLSLAHWLAAELSERHGVPKALAERWVKNEKIVPLLDGLDEVVVDYRELCVEAVNEFRRDHSLMPIVVCSRVADYEELSTKLRLPFAVEIQPLSRSQIQDYLQEVGKPLRGVQEALQKDPSLWGLLDTPLMLWVVMLAYRDAPFEVSSQESLERRRAHLFAKFVDEMLDRRPNAPYSPQQTCHWLSRLAHGLANTHETVFYLEDLRPEWLPTRAQKLISGVGTFVAVWLLIGLIFGVIDSIIETFTVGLKDGIVHGSIVALEYGLFYAVLSALLGLIIEIRPIESRRIVLINLSRLWRALLVGVGGGAAFGLIAGIFDGPIAGVAEGLIVGFFIGLASLLSREPKETRKVPNQGANASARVALATVLIVAIAVGPLGGIFTGLILGLLGGLIFGGLFCLRHLVLRLVLWVSGGSPSSFVSFLNYATDRLLLRRIGGGYIFTHRMLADYFRTLPLTK
ncbi:MAG: hypothetical protein DMG96_14990 [Acidobacteria bacterium]|nr:MAG: hypothetical protein DMG96_14990 [Acidobacteriota bacterium]